MATFIVEGTEGRRQQHAAALWRAPMAIDRSSPARPRPCQTLARLTLRRTSVRVPVRPDILPRALNFATCSRFKVGWWRLGPATAPRTGALGLETPGNRVGGGSVSYVTAETLPFKNWATFGFRRYSALRLNFRQQRIHYTRDQPQKLDSRRHDIRTALASCIIS